MLQFICRGRMKYKFYVLISSVIITLICCYFFVQIKNSSISPVTPPPYSSGNRNNKHLSKIITAVFRQFEEFENDIADSVQSFISAYPNMQVLVISESAPYPPLSFSASNESLKNVHIISLELRLNASPKELDPINYINTEYALFLPDSTRMSRRAIQQAVAVAMAAPSKAVALGMMGSKLLCQEVRWDYADWTLQYTKLASASVCDAVQGPHALLIRTALLRTLPQPFMQPFPEALYLQTAVKNIKIQTIESRLSAGRAILRNPAARQRAARKLREQRTTVYKQLGVKAVVREDGRVQWFGCKRETQRCFPSVVGTPSFVLSGRNTPPCCRRNLRRTVNHVLRVLAGAGARCWLETTSLLGAVVHGELLSWAEYAEVGIHAEDVSRVTWLSSSNRGGVDADGYVWERATRGRYYRAAYSPNNRLYVLILPFIPKNGTMWPADWVLAHQKEFSERHLHPLAQIQFAGRRAPAPNDARAFLDHKLGVGALEKNEKLGPKLLYP